MQPHLQLGAYVKNLKGVLPAYTFFWCLDFFHR